LAKINEKANEILADRHVHCSSVADLPVARDKLERFVDYWQRRREAALEAIKILDQMADEEQDRVADLFGENSRATEYFSMITNGRYRSVEYDHDQGGPGLIVRQLDGTPLQPHQLSGGAFDQLYLSVRLALAEKLLREEPGFLLLDDPFIKADPGRFRSQMRMLKDLADNGWQILYFSAKQEVREVCSDGALGDGVQTVTIGT
jgi:uncharacterized protein YhaN